MTRQHKIKWRVRGDWRGSFSGYERALKRARDLAKIARTDFEVIEIDLDGNETPVAVVKYSNAKKKEPAK